MDFLNKAKEQFSQNSEQLGQQGQQGQQGQGNVGQNMQGQNTGAMGGNNTNVSGGQEDYGDKGLDFIEKKTGHTMGRDTNEKITDGARGLFEKATGKTVDSKWSN